MFQKMTHLCADFGISDFGFLTSEDMEFYDEKGKNKVIYYNSKPIS